MYLLRLHHMASESQIEAEVHVLFLIQRLSMCVISWKYEPKQRTTWYSMDLYHKGDITEGALVLYATWIFNFWPYKHLRAIRGNNQLWIMSNCSVFSCFHGQKNIVVSTMKNYRIVASTNTSYYSENQLFVQRSQYIRTENPLHKQSEKAKTCH